ncbi:hypothetical protein PAPHI01_0444 [Pancytospora philotis]|nr:hypothetical protein PAPHI01_0444 [Pancytospora philotis]
MVAVRALAFGTAFVALFLEASTKPQKTDRRARLLLRNVTPFKDVANERNNHEKAILNALCERTGKIPGSAKQHRVPALLEMLLAAIFEDADPITFINEKIAVKTVIFERAMIANAIRLKLSILRDSTQYAGAANDKLCARMDSTLKKLDELYSEKCKSSFHEFYTESVRTSPHGRYDLVLYLFSAYTEGKEEGVRKKFCDIIDTGLPCAENGYGAIPMSVRAFLTYLKDIISVYKIDKFDFTKMLLKHLTSKADYEAVPMVDHLGWDGITKDSVLQYITSGGDKDVSLRFVVNFLTRNRLLLNESCTWVKERLLDFFREPHMTSVRKDAPAEHFHYMLCTCFDDRGLRPIVPELAQFVSELVDPRTFNVVMELAENDPYITGLLDEVKKHISPLALGMSEQPRAEQGRKRHDTAEDDGTAKKARSAAELAVLAPVRTSAAFSMFEMRCETGKALDQISPNTKFFQRARKAYRGVIDVLNDRAHRILRSERSFVNADSWKYKGDYIIPNMMHRITKCVLSAGSPESRINELLKEKIGLSSLKLLAGIIRVVTTTEVKTSRLEVELIVPHGEELPCEAQEAIGILQVRIDEQLRLSPSEFLAKLNTQGYLCDIVEYLFKDKDSGIQAVQATFEGLLKAWCDEMNRGSNAFTYFLVSLISELEKDLCAKEMAQYKFRDVVLRILTTQANIKVVEALDRIEFHSNEIEKCILVYIMNPEHRHISPNFVLQYISHIQRRLGRDDEWVLETQLAFFALLARAADRQLMLVNGTEILCRMRVKLLARLLYAYWKELPLRSGLPRLFSVLSRTFDPFVVLFLVNEAGQCGDADFVEAAQRGFLDSPVTAQAGEQCQRSGQDEDGGQEPSAI